MVLKKPVTKQLGPAAWQDHTALEKARIPKNLGVFICSDCHNRIPPTDSLTNRHLFLTVHSSRAWKSKIKVLANWDSSESFPSGLHRTHYSLGVHMASSQGMYTERESMSFLVPLCIRTRTPPEGHKDSHDLIMTLVIFLEATSLNIASTQEFLGNTHIQFIMLGLPQFGSPLFRNSRPHFQPPLRWSKPSPYLVPTSLLPSTSFRSPQVPRGPFPTYSAESFLCSKTSVDPPLSPESGQ